MPFEQNTVLSLNLACEMSLNPPKGSFAVRTFCYMTWDSRKGELSQSPEGVICRSNDFKSYYRHDPYSVSQSPEGVICRSNLFVSFHQWLLLDSCLNPPKGSFAVRTERGNILCQRSKAVSIPRRGHLPFEPFKWLTYIPPVLMSQSPEGVICRSNSGHL